MANEQYIRFEDFSGGIDDTTASHLLALNESPEIINFWSLAQFGILVKRHGYAKLNTDALASAAICGLTKYFTVAGGAWTVAACGYNLYSITDAGVSADIVTGTLSATGNETHFLTINDLLYFCNGNATDRYMKWDGSTAVTSANATGPTDSGNVTVKHIFWDSIMNRMWAIGGGVWGSKAYYSGILLPEAWSGYESFSPDDGDALVCGCCTSSRRLFFKSRSIFALYGSAPSEFFKTKIQSDYGTDAPRSVVVDGDDVYFFGSDGRFHLLSGNKPIVISFKVDNTCRNISKSMRAKVAGTKYYHYILWSYADGASVNNKVLVYDTRTGSWSRFHGISASCWHTIIHGAASYAAIFGGSPATSGRVYTFDSGLSDDGANIYWSWRSKTLSPGLGWPFPCDLGRIYLLAKRSTTRSISWNIDASYGSRTVAGSFAFTTTGATYGDGSLYGDGTVYGGADFEKKSAPCPLSGDEFRILISGTDQDEVFIKKVALSFRQTRGEGWAK